MTKIRISMMLFLQYMILPVWLLPLIPYLRALPGGADWIFAFGILSGVGTLLSPFICMFADRFFNAERVLAICNLATALLLASAFFVTSPALLFALLLPALVVYMATWSLSSAIAMAHLSPLEFPAYRVWGSIGWVASGVFSLIAAKVFDFKTFDTSHWIFIAGAATALVATIVALSQKATPPSAKGRAFSVVDALGLRAFALFRDPTFAIFGAIVFLAMIPFQWYMVYLTSYLSEVGFQFLTLTQNLGQVAEIIFLLCVPWMVKRFGYRISLTVGLGFLSLRYAFFILAYQLGFAGGDFIAILLQGSIFGLIVLLGQMYVGETAPPELRTQAQGLIILLTSGVGLFASNAVIHPLITLAARPDATHAWTLPFGVSGAIAFVLMITTLLFFKPRQTLASGH